MFIVTLHIIIPGTYSVNMIWAIFISHCSEACWDYSADCTYTTDAMCRPEHGALNYVIRGKAGLEMLVSVVSLIDNQVFLQNISFQKRCGAAWAVYVWDNEHKSDKMTEG